MPMTGVPKAFEATRQRASTLTNRAVIEEVAMAVALLHDNLTRIV